MRLFFSLLFFLVLTQTAAAQTKYSKSAELPALRVSFSDLQGVVDKAAKLASSANGNASTFLEEVTLKTGKTKLVISGNLLVPPGARVPEKIDSFEYRYVASGKAAPISSINLDFSDFRRTITIEGPSPEQVDAIFVTIREDLNSLSSTFGGYGWTLLFGFPAYMAFGLLLLWSFSTWYFERHPAVLALMIFSLVALALLLTLPKEEFLAGFAAYRGEPSFLVRYGPHMGFVGLLLSLAPIPIAIFKRLSVAPAALVPTPQETPVTALPSEKSLPSDIKPNDEPSQKT